MRIHDCEQGPTPPEVVAAHVALPATRPSDTAFVRLNMVASADGGSAVAGLSGGLGNGDDHAVFAALREQADAVIVGMSTAIDERYHPPASPHLQLYVIASRPDISPNAALFESRQVTLVLPEGAAPAPEGVTVLRAGDGRRVDLGRVVETLAGQVVIAEGGPSLAGTMIASGLVDEFFLTVSPRLISGDSARVVHGPEADPAIWRLGHGFVDADGFLFLKYARIGAPATGTGTSSPSPG